MNKNIDIMDVESFPEYDILYCDPPWEQRMVKFFQTKLKKDTGIEVNNTIEDILNHLGRLASKNKPLYVEYSVKGYENVVATMEKHGHVFNNARKLTQANGNPFVVCVFNSHCVIGGDLKGGTVVEYVTKYHNNPLVFDPFAGIGFTAKHVYKAGGRYIGYEINPMRFERLQKVCGKYEDI